MGKTVAYFQHLDSIRPPLGTAIVEAFADNNGHPGPGIIDMGWATFPARKEAATRGQQDTAPRGHHKQARLWP